jgi:hypothetical protein
MLQKEARLNPGLSAHMVNLENVVVRQKAKEQLSIFFHKFLH